MATITFSNWQKVNFNWNPTPEDVDFVAKQLGITSENKPGILDNRWNQIKEAYQKTASWQLNPVSGAVRTVGAVAGWMGDILFEWLKAITPTPIKEAVKSWVKAVASTQPAQLAIKTLDDWSQKYPEAAKDLWAAINIASVLPIAKGVAKWAEVAGNAWKTLLRSAAPKAGEALQTIWALGEKTGKAVVSASYPPVEQAGRVIAYKAKTPLLERLSQASKGIEKAPVTPADVLIKYDLSNISRSWIGIKAKRITDKLWKNQVEPVLWGIKDRVKTSDIFNWVNKEIAKIKDISNRKTLEEAMASLADDYKHTSSFSIKTLDKIKSEMAHKLPASTWKGKDITWAMNNVRKMFSDKARVIVRSKLPENVIAIYDDYWALQDLITVGTKALKSWLNTNLIGATWEAFRMATTPITTIGGSTISKVGTGIRKLGTKLLKK